MSWVSNAVERLRQPHNNGSAWAIERAVREAIEEAARRAVGGSCDFGCGHHDCMVYRAASASILAMLKDAP